MSEDRNEAGQFTPAEPLTGTAEREAAAGYQPFVEPAVETDDTSPITVEEAAADLSASRTDIESYSPIDAFLDTLPENTTLTIEQAAKLTSEHKEAEAKAAEEAAADKLRAETDERRGIEAEKAIPPEVKAMIDTGVDPKVAEALQHPQVREAVEQEFSRADQVRESYTAGLEQARIASLASLAEIVPHLAGLDPARFEEGLAVLQQVDPPAFNQAMNVLQRTNQIVQAQQQAQHHQAQVQQAQMQEYGRAEDARFKSMIGAERIAQLNTDLVPYLQKIGVDPQVLVHELQTNPRLRSAEAQKLVADAVAYDRMQNTVLKAAPKSLPPVQRPGSSSAAKSSEPSTKIQALERQLATATGDRAARISAQIYGLEKSARG
jgi:hypothetical protein